MIVPALSALAVPIDSIKPDPQNVRRHPEPNRQAIKKSLQGFQQRKPIVVNKRTMIIEAGNGLWQEMKSLGAKEIAVVFVDDTDEQAKAYGIMDNRSAELAEWDIPALKDMLQDLDTGSLDMDLTGFDSKALEDLMTQTFQPKAGLTDDDAVPEPKETVCKKGDLWILGKHRLLCGDSTKVEDVARLMNGEKAALLVTDPPYGVSYADKNKFLNTIGRPNSVQDPIEADHQTPEAMQDLWCAAFGTVREWISEGASYYVTGPQGGDLLLLLLLSLKESGFPLRHMLIWAKNQFVIGRSDYHYQHEPII